MDQLCLQFLEPELILLLGGEIPDEAGEQPLPVFTGLANRQLHREGRAVAALADHDAAEADDPALAGLEIMRDIFVMPVAIGLGHQAGDVAADELGFRIAEQALGGRAERRDVAGLVDDDHRIGDGRQDRLEMLLAGLD